MTAPIAITQILRLHQIVCSSPRRVDALVETLEEVSGKAIIWAIYRADIARITERLRSVFGEDCLVVYDGTTASADRPTLVDAFQAEGGPQFFIGQPKTGGYGLTLTAASTVVYYGNSYDLEIRLQSEDRAHRIGQRSAVTYVDLVTPGTVDERILDALRSKRDLANAVLGEWQEWI